MHSDETAAVRQEGRTAAKRVADSRTEVTRNVTERDMNGQGRLFGGRLMEWIDEAAGIAARRHCGGNVTTACVDQLVFHHPAFRNDVVVIDARVTYVGRSSLEVRVDSYVEDIARATRNLINRAYLTEVFVGDDGAPRPVPYGLDLASDAERDEWRGAERRRQMRRQRSEEGF
jgi:acyl-CoA hydrolase